MPALTTSRYPEAAARFAADVAKHRMLINHDHGLYRHLQFRVPDTGMYWFDLLTWPGALCVNGDMGTFVFARLDDMFEFFRGPGDINASYWAEKVRAGSGVKAYSSDLFVKKVRDYVTDHLRDEGATKSVRRRLTEAVEADVLYDGTGWESEQEARNARRSARPRCSFRWHRRFSAH